MRKYVFVWIAIALIAVLCVWLWHANRTDIFTREDGIAATGDKAERQLRFILTEIQRFADRSNHAPGTLSILIERGGLSADALEDPFSPGNRIKYKKLEGGRFLLWSVGPDGKDDGGEPNLYGIRVTSSSTGDIALGGTVGHLVDQEG